MPLVDVPEVKYDCDNSAGRPTAFVYSHALSIKKRAHTPHPIDNLLLLLNRNGNNEQDEKNVWNTT